MGKGFERIFLFLDRILNGIIILVSAVILLVSSYSLFDNYRIHREASDPSLLVYKPSTGDVQDADEEWLDGQAAWIIIDGSYIDFPVMQGKNNYEYLNKDPYGEFKLSGSIFLDSRSAGDFSDEYSMIYGHHMDHYSMFGSLDLFATEVYFKNHCTGYLMTRDAHYELDLFAVVWGDAGDRIIFMIEGQTAAEVAAYIDENAVINTGYEPGRRIVALSTCAGETGDSRLIVFGMIKDKV